MTFSWFIKYTTEFVGAALIVIFVNSLAAKLTKDSKHKNLIIGAGFGIGVFVSTLVFSGISLSLFNPAYTLGLAVSGLFSWNQAWEYIIAQVAGAIVGQLIVIAMQYKHFQDMDDATQVLQAFATIPASDDRSYGNRGLAMVQGAVTEFFASFVYFFVSIGLLGYMASYAASYYTSQASQSGTAATTTYKATQTAMVQAGFTQGFGASTVVGSLLLGLLTFGLVWATGAALNPARDFGPRLVHAFLPASAFSEAKDDSRWWYAWVPVVMPIIAAILAAALVKMMYMK